MQVTCTKIDDANVCIEATIPQSDIHKKIDQIAKQAAKQMKIDGFRPGKAPVAIVKKRLGDRLQQDAEAEALRDILNRGSQELSLNAEQIIGEPAVTKFDRQETTIAVELKLSLRPEIVIDEIDAIIPEVQTPEVSQEEVQERIEALAQAQAPFISLQEDRGLQEGDLAVIDFKGYVDGEPIEGGEAENFELKIGSGQFIPGFEEQLIGMKKGEEKRIEVVFPESYRNEKLAGKTATFDVKLHDIKVKEAVTIDDALAQKILGKEDATLETLKEQVANELISEKLSKLYNEELKPKLVEALIKHFSFALPQSVVEQEIDLGLRNKLQQMGEEEIAQLREDSQKVEALREELRGDAEQSVKATFIIDALARKEGIEVSDEELMQTIYYEALNTGQDPQQTFQYYQQQNLLPAIKMAMIEDRVLTKLLNDKKEKKGASQEASDGEKEEA